MDISLSCRFFPVSEAAPKHTVLLRQWRDGPTITNDIAPLYNQIGVNFFVADYRGYGAKRRVAPPSPPCWPIRLGCSTTWRGA